jgi:hypothetical protein
MLTYIHNAATNVSVASGGWFYFYSDYWMLGDTLTVRAAQTSAAAGSVDLYLGSGLRCPDANDSSVSRVGKGAFSRYSIELDSELGLQSLPNGARFNHSIKQSKLYRQCISTSSQYQC